MDSHGKLLACLETGGLVTVKVSYHRKSALIRCQTVFVCILDTKISKAFISMYISKWGVFLIFYMLYFIAESTSKFNL